MALAMAAPGGQGRGERKHESEHETRATRIYHTRDNNRWRVVDVLSQMRQLGAIPGGFS
jgi:hypothetical protein